VNVESPAATEFYIRRVGQTSYQLGYSTDNLQTLVQYGANVTVEASFEPDLVGFYSDARGGDGVAGLTASSGTFDNLRIIDPTNPATVFAVEGDFTLENGSSLEFQLNGDNVYGMAVVNGTFHAGGTLAVLLGSGYTPGAGDTYDLLDVHASTGLFNLAQLPSLPLGLVWDTSQLMSAGQLSVVAGLVGDFNGNNVVDSADYVVWRKSNGAVGVNLAADANRDLHVDQLDYDLMRSNYGKTLPIGSALAAAIPEPASIEVIVSTILAFQFGSARRARRCLMQRRVSVAG